MEDIRKIYIGADHAGYELKGELTIHLEKKGYEVVDMGAYELDDEDDYPDFVIPVAEAVRREEGDAKGIVIGGSGQGEAMACNRFPGIRASVFYGQHESEDSKEVPNTIVLSREHNDANILALGARFLNDDEAKEAVDLWLETEFSGEERHKRRIEKIDEI